MDRATIAILLILAVSVTPSVSDAVQLYLTEPKYLAICIVWWVLLVMLLCCHWRALT
jgi:hypothetical protein